MNVRNNKFSGNCLYKESIFFLKLDLMQFALTFNITFNMRQRHVKKGTTSKKIRKIRN